MLAQQELLRRFSLEAYMQMEELGLPPQLALHCVDKANDGNPLKRKDGLNVHAFTSQDQPGIFRQFTIAPELHRAARALVVVSDSAGRILCAVERPAEEVMKNQLSKFAPSLLDRAGDLPCSIVKPSNWLDKLLASASHIAFGTPCLREFFELREAAREAEAQANLARSQNHDINQAAYFHRAAILYGRAAKRITGPTSKGREDLLCSARSCRKEGNAAWRNARGAYLLKLYS